VPTRGYASVKLTCFDYILFIFCVKTTHYSALIVFAHVPVSVCEELLSQPDNNNTAAVVQTLNYEVLHYLPNFDLNFSLSECTDSANICDYIFV